MNQGKQLGGEGQAAIGGTVGQGQTAVGQGHPAVGGTVDHENAALGGMQSKAKDI